MVVTFVHNIVDHNVFHTIINRYDYSGVGVGAIFILTTPLIE